MRSSSVVTPRPWSAGRDTFDALLEMLWAATQPVHNPETSHESSRYV
jgi:hypothetical protein